MLRVPSSLARSREFFDSFAVAGSGGGQYAAPPYNVRVDEVAVGEDTSIMRLASRQGEGDELLVGECHFREAGVFATAAVGEAHNVAAGFCCVATPLPFGGGVGEALARTAVASSGRAGRYRGGACSGRGHRRQG